MSTKSIWVFARTAAILIGVVLFALGLVNENAGVYWAGTLLFMVGLLALARATMAEAAAGESDQHHG